MRFELRPVPDTKPFLDDFVNQDIQRDKDYQELKAIIDEYHKVYIEKSLSRDSILDIEKMQELKKWTDRFNTLKTYSEKQKLKKEMESIQEELRKSIKTQFDESAEELRGQIKKSKKSKANKADDNTENSKQDTGKKRKNPLFTEELITDILPKWLNSFSWKEIQKTTSLKEKIKDYLNNKRASEVLSNHQKKESDETDFQDWKAHYLQVVEKFNRFTTYLKGFHDNRKNMYSDKEQVTAVSHRIINENLPKFFSNMDIYKKINKNFSDLPEQLESIKSDLKEEFDYFQITNLSQLFEISCFNKCLTQKGIDHYNAIIGGKTKEDKEKIQGINEKINLYRQKKQIKNLPFMQGLYKQILSDRESHSFLPESFENNQEFCEAIQTLWKHISEQIDNTNKNLLESIEQLLMDISEDKNQISSIYFNKSKLSALSNRLFSEWSVIDSALKEYSESIFNNKKEREKFLKQDFFSFQDLHEALIKQKNEEDESSDLATKIPEKNILLHYFENIVSHFKFILKEERKPSSLFSEKQAVSEIINSFYDEIKNVLSNPPAENKKFNKKEIEFIKNFLDSVLEFFHLVKPLYLEKDKKKLSDVKKDDTFYNEFEPLYEKLSHIVQLYNKCRNYIATNKIHLKKVKINFEDNTLLDGWDVNKESDNLSVILRKKKKAKWIYYLGIMNRNSRKIFDYHIKNKDSDATIQKKDILKNNILVGESKQPYFEKMNYKQISDPNKDIQNLMRIDDRVCRKTINLDTLKEKHLPSKIWNIKKKGSYLSGPEHNPSDLKTFISYYQEMAKEYWKQFELKLKSSEKYQNFKDFTDDIASQSYKLSFDKIKENYIEKKVQNGDLYLFQIYNKDFSEHSKGKPNIHTSYFKLLFDDENLKDTILKLNGQAEIFYRKSSMKKEVIHQKNKPIANKNPLNPKSQSTFGYDIVKNRRWTEDRFFVHVPINLNFKQKTMKSYQFNQKVLESLKSNKNVNIIGIDRGERHLAYYTVINQKKDMLEQGSFNIISTEYKNQNSEKIDMNTNYHKLLETKEQERDQSRKSWDKIENIKELKSGYLSHLVHQIAKLMIKHNAIVVFEDLNKGFKHGRMKFEKQVYQKLEKALIDKLNYLVFKNIEDLKQPGGLLKAYQLTAPFKSLNKMGKQTGFVFYTPAHYTSKVDPKTGFINLIYPRYTTVEKSQKLFKRFESIFYDKEKDFFVFEYSDGKVNPDKKSESNGKWVVCTHGSERYKYNNKQKTTQKVNVTVAIKKLFDQYNIQYQNGEDIRDTIIKQDKKDFFIHLICCLKLTLQLRHINPEAKHDQEKDFILSPVADEKGRFFDSRKAKNNEPQNADANGAYHIALKGLIMLNKLDQWDSTSRTPDLKVHNKEWFNFIKPK